MTPLSIARWLVSLVGTLALSGLVWLFGPLLSVLEDTSPRLAVVALMLVLWACANLLIDLARGSRDRALSTGVAASATAEEATAIEGGLTKALALLKKKQKGRGYLYEQPWYVIIGPPGAGKTTALLNAGLHFPLAAEMGQGAVSGVGGTRLCDWWFTNEAVLIDTAGRYTTQDSDASVDRAGWDAFLDLLKRTRPRQPLNGVIVAIALSDIAANSAEETARHAKAISQRVRELETRLGIRLPVYALFTKADLIVGFSEYFDDLDRDRRRQVWGITFPYDASASSAASSAAPDPASLVSRFLQLAERLNQRLIARLATEPSAERRALIAGFPAQVASLAQPLARFLDEAFGAAPVPLLRGAYFASGTQEGTPIDRLTGVLSRSFGLDQRRAATLRPEQGRSYFLGDLLTRVVFGEALLASDNPAVRKRMFLLRTGICSVAGLAVLAAGLVLWRVHATEMAAIETATLALSGYEQTASKLSLDPVSDDDLRQLVPLLNQAAALTHKADGNTDAIGVGIGLSQSGKLAQASRTVYRHALERALLPRLIWRLEAQIRGNMARPDFLYEATRIYLMLGNLGPLDRNSVEEWMGLDWQATYPGDKAASLRRDLATHLDALLIDEMPTVQLDGALIAQARASFGKVTLAQRVYARIRGSVAAQRVAPWNPAGALGPAGVRLFVRASGRKLTDGIAGLFTRDGFAHVLLPSIPVTAQSVAAESWVLGQKTTLNPNGAEMRDLQIAVVALYSTEDIDAWDRMLTDLEVAPLRSLTQAAQDLYILSSRQSPLRGLLSSVVHEVSLTEPDAAAATNPAGTSRLQVLLGPAATASTASEQPGTAVAAHFKPLRDLIGDGGPGPLDPVLQSLYDLQQQLAKLAAAPIGSTPPQPSGSDPAVLLRAQAARLPQPLSRWMTTMAASGTALRSGDAHQQISTAWNAAGGPAAFCVQSVKGHFPFDRTATANLSLGDFNRLMAPGAVLDGFFNTQLAPFADTSGKVWKPKSTGSATPPVSSDDIAQFQRAATLRDLFFPGGATTPVIRFDITPVSLDPVSASVTLDLDGTEVHFAHGPPQASQISWPGANHMQNVRLMFNPPVTDGESLAESGPWALFRLMAHARLQSDAKGDHVIATFQQGNRRAAFDIHPIGGGDPFVPGLIEAFRCPAVP
jgi:type VI secretion system protein ImpL